MAKQGNPSQAPDRSQPSIKQRLNNLLAVESVQKVYIVDEQIAETYPFEVFKGLVNSIDATQLEKVQIGGKSLREKEVAFIQIEPLWEDWSSEVRREAIAEIAKQSNSEMALDAQQPSKLKTIFEDDIIDFITPEEWESKKTSIIETLIEPNKILVLFDEELQREDGRKGHDFIHDVKSHGKIIIPVLFSNGISTYADELTKRDLIISESNGLLDEQDFFALSKSRTNDGEDFADGLKKALLNNYCQKIKTASINVLEEAFKKSIAEVQKLDPYDFDYVVLETSYSEGIWEGFTFHRIAQILFDDALHSEMIKQNFVSKFNKDIRASKAIREQKFKHSAATLYKAKYKLRHQEFYYDGLTINSLHFPIENGDIFEIAQGENKSRYILVGQECDLAIRADGKGDIEKEGVRKLKVGTLLKIDPAVNFDKQHGSNFQLEYLEDDTWESACVVFNNPFFVDLNFLDLTAFHPEGLAELDLNEGDLESINLSFGWEKRLLKIKKYFKLKHSEYMRKISFVKQIHKSKIAPDLLPIFSFPENILYPSYSTNTISIAVKRIKRLRSPYSKNLLEKFTRYQSRGADPHNIAK